MKDGNKVRKNLIVGILGQAVSILLGVLLPRLILSNFGSEVNGLLSSVTNIYAYIAIVEAGVAAASCQALYKPISQGNKNRVNAVLSASNKYYHRTGAIYLALIFAFSILYPLFIKTDIPFATVVLIILFNGLGNVVNYFFHGKYLILLKADGKNYIRTGLEIFTNSFKQISKIVLISAGFDIVTVHFAAMLVSYAQMICITCYIKKSYSWIDLRVKPDFKSLSQSKYVFVHEINYLITSNVDTVLLTVFSTLKTVSVYSLYTLLFGMVTRVLRTVKDALEFKIAHEYHRDQKTFLKLFEAYEAYYITFAFSLFTIVNYFIFPFMRLYTNGITDINYIQKYLPAAFVMVHLLEAGRYPSDAMVHISGHFQQTKNSAMIETAINIVVSVILVLQYEIIGALLGTIIASLYRTNYLILYVNKRVIGRKAVGTYKCWGINFAIYCMIAWLNQFIVPDLNTYIRVFLFCVPYSLLILMIYFTLISLCMPNAFQYVQCLVKSIMERKLGKGSGKHGG